MEPGPRTGLISGLRRHDRPAGDQIIDERKIHNCNPPPLVRGGGFVFAAINLVSIAGTAAQETPCICFRITADDDGQSPVNCDVALMSGGAIARSTRSNPWRSKYRSAELVISQTS